MVDRNYTHCKLLRTQLLVAILLLIAGPAFSQTLPNDRQSDGLKGPVHVVVEANIGRKPQADTIHRKSTHWIVVQDTQQVFLFFKKVKPRRVKVDTMEVEYTTRWVPDTIYYCRTEYTPEGFLKSRFLVKDHGKVHEVTTTTFHNNCKLEMRTYCRETGVTTQWHYHYSEYGKEPQLEQVIVTEYKEKDYGEIVERVEYEHIGGSNTCIESHFRLSDKPYLLRKYEDGLLMYMTCENDTNRYYWYDADARLKTIECNVAEKPIYTEGYRYTPTGVYLTHTPLDERYGLQPQPTIVTYDEEYDGSGNWTQRTIDGKDSRKREIIYYNR